MTLLVATPLLLLAICNADFVAAEWSGAGGVVGVAWGVLQQDLAESDHPTRDLYPPHLWARDGVGACPQVRASNKGSFDIGCVCCVMVFFLFY